MKDGLKLESELYLKSGGAICPYCGSKNIEGSGVRSMDGNTMSNEVECQTCQRNWWDIYTLTGVEETK